MDPVKYYSIYSKYNQKEINELDSRMAAISEEITKNSIAIQREVDELVFNFFKQYIVGPQPISQFTKDDLEQLGKPFKITQEKFPIGNEMWDSYKLEHNEKGLCAYFIYKLLLEEDKIVYKKINVLEYN